MFQFNENFYCNKKITHRWRNHLKLKRNYCSKSIEKSIKRNSSKVKPDLSAKRYLFAKNNASQVKQTISGHRETRIFTKYI